MQENTKWIIGIIILIGIILIVSGKINLPNIFSAVSFMEISCSKTGNYNPSIWTCSNWRGSITEGSGGKISFMIMRPASPEWYALRLETAKDINSDLKNFFNTHTYASAYNYAYGIYTPYDSGWDTKLGLVYIDLGAGVPGWLVPWAVPNPIIQTQFVVVEGTYINEGSPNNGENVRTYGLCNGQSCWIYDPHPEQGYSLSNKITKGLVNVNSIKIYSKDGGYTEEEGKEEYGFNIVCNTPADLSPCDGKVDRNELGIYINGWISGSVTRDNLGLAIQAWIG